MIKMVTLMLAIFYHSNEVNINKNVNISPKISMNYPVSFESMSFTWDNINLEDP